MALIAGEARTTRDFYTKYLKEWKDNVVSLFGITPIVSLDDTTDERIQDGLDKDAEKYWNNPVYVNDIRDRIVRDMLNVDHMIQNSWALHFNTNTNTILIRAIFVDKCKNPAEKVSKITKDWVNGEFSEGEDGYFEFLCGEKARYRTVAFSPLFEGLGVRTKTANYTFRVKAAKNTTFMQKKEGVIKYKGFTFVNGDWEDGEDHFDDINKAQYPLLSAVIGEKITRKNYKRAMKKLPEYDSHSLVYFTFSGFDSIKEYMLVRKYKCNPFSSVNVNLLKMLKQMMPKNSNTTQDLTDNLIYSKTKLKSLDIYRTISYSYTGGYMRDFSFTDGKEFFDSFKTPTSMQAGRTRTLLDDVVVEDGMLKVVVKDGKRTKKYSHLEVILGDVELPERSTLSCVSQFRFNHINDAKRIMMCSKAKGQAVAVDGEEDNILHTVPARVVFADIKGFNLGDSLIISRSFAEKLKRHVTLPMTCSSKNSLKQLKAGKHLTQEELYKLTKKAKYNQLENVVVRKVTEDTFFVSCDIPCGVGDKLSNFHASKGVISIVLDDDKMPILKHDLTQKMKAGPVDIVISGLSVYDRKNLGQIFESVAGAFGFDEEDLPTIYKKYGDEIAEYDKNSEFTFQGEKFKAPCGICEIVRLDHDSYTKQSFSYIKSNTNFCLRVGEQELLNLISRGKTEILNELDYRALSKHADSLKEVWRMQKTGKISHREADNSRLKELLRTIGYELNSLTEDENISWEDEIMKYALQEQRDRLFNDGVVDDELIDLFA